MVCANFTYLLHQGSTQTSFYFTQLCYLAFVAKFVRTFEGLKVYKGQQNDEIPHAKTGNLTQ